MVAGLGLKSGILVTPWTHSTTDPAVPPYIMPLFCRVVLAVDMEQGVQFPLYGTRQAGQVILRNILGRFHRRGNYW